MFFRPFIYLILPGLLFSGCKGDSDATKERSGPKALTVGAIVVNPETLENRIVATGNIKANEEVELRSEVSGRVVLISFTEGSRVQKGETLLKTDDRELQAQLKKLRIEEKEASDDLFRKERLLDLKAISQEEFDKASNVLSVIRAQIDLVTTQISKTEIIAPFSGEIGLRQVSPGSYISSLTPVARLQQTDPVKIDFAVPEKYKGKIAKGTRISFTVEGSDSTHHAQVYALESGIDPSTRSVLVRAICSNPGKTLVPGAFAKVNIVLDNITDALVIPAESVIPVMNGEKVFVCRNGKAQSQMVETGIRTEREVQVTGGLLAGDTVITTGILQLREGATIKTRIRK
jgi:membrane fusion protein (multidrug efflux system)